MIVRRYEIEDFKQIRLWGEQWGAVYNEEQFPNTGFIIDGVAAYFLYSTDSTVCWLENMVSRKGLEKAVRSRACDLLIDAAFNEAIAQGFSVAYATTDLISMAKRARAFGAQIKPQQFLITKDLTKFTQLQ